MGRILRTSFADADLSEIWKYLAKRNPAAADALIRRLDETVHQLARSPDLGIRRDDLRAGLYCKPVRRNYLIF